MYTLAPPYDVDPVRLGVGVNEFRLSGARLILGDKLALGASLIFGQAETTFEVANTASASRSWALALDGFLTGSLGSACGFQGIHCNDVWRYLF